MPRKKVDKEALPDDSVEDILVELDKCYQLHDGQKILDAQVFEHKRKRIFAQCGRNWGKSVSIAYICAKFALTNKNVGAFIICPEKEQAREIYWASGLLRGMLPDKYVAKNQQNRDDAQKGELRIRLTNKSFIKLLGADEPNRLRGIKPHFCAYDEYRDFKENAFNVMEANLIGKNATLLIGSTPPDVTGQYSELREDFISQIKTNNQSYFYLELPTETNPHISKERLQDIKRRLIAHGKMREWLREYMAKFIPGGASAVFPMFAERRDSIVKPAYVLNELIKNERQAFDWYAIFDPASSSVFAVMIAAVNKFTSQIFILKEIYEKDRYKTSSIDIWKRTNELKKLYMRDLSKWENVYDEHESWFYRDLERYEILELEGAHLDPTEKQSRDKQEDLATIKDLMLLDNKFFISDECPHLIDEFESYVTDKDGKLIKRKDHQIDNCRYLISASGFSLNEAPDYEGYLEKVRESKLEPPGFNEFITSKRKQDDWTYDLDESSILTENIIHVEDLGYGELF